MKIISAIENVTISDAFLIALMGFVMVFLVMALLIGALYLFKAVFKIKWLREDNSKSAKNELAETFDNDEDEATVAAITAAISMILVSETVEENVPIPSFKIKNIKRIK